MPSKFFREALAKGKPENRRFVQKNLDLVARIVAVMNEQDLSVAELAEQWQRPKPEVERVLAGLYNFTWQEIVQLEELLGEELIEVVG